MFIKLTNAAPAHRGNDIVLNTSIIVSVSREKLERQVDETISTVEEVTLIFCPPHGTWEVSESVDEVTALLNNTGCCK